MAESKQKAKISIFILNHLMIKGLFLPMFPEEYEVRLVRLVPEAQIIDIRIVHDNFTFTNPWLNSPKIKNIFRYNPCAPYYGVPRVS